MRGVEKKICVNPSNSINSDPCSGSTIKQCFAYNFQILLAGFSNIYCYILWEFIKFIENRIKLGPVSVKNSLYFFFFFFTETTVVDLLFGRVMEMFWNVFRRRIDTDDVIMAIVVNSKNTTLAAVLALMVIGAAMANSVDLNLCIRNCHQCKKMLGAYFEGQLCAETCVKFKGKMIPDCENLDSVAPFLNKDIAVE